MNLQKIRAEFPFLKTKPTPIYLDNAATTQKPQVVLDTISDFYTSHCGNVGRGNHRFTHEATQLYEAAREKVARFIFASPQEIIFTRNTTESINLISSTLGEKIVQKEDTILLTQLEHHSNLLPWIQLAQRKKANLEFLPVDQKGKIDFHSFLPKLKNKSIKIFSLAHVSNVLGTINPVRKIIEQVKKDHPEIITIVDAAQSIAHIPVNLDHLKCDFLAFSAHKMYGPMGIGVLYGRKKLLENLDSFLVGGGIVKEVSWNNFVLRRSPIRFEAGTPNVAGAVGLKTAIKFIEEIGIKQIIEHEKELTEYLLKSLRKSNIAGMTIYGPENLAERIGIISLNIKGIHAEELTNYLDDDNIMVRAGHHCTMPLHHEILKTDSTLRISLAIYNTKKEVDRLLQSLQKAIKMLR